MKTSEFILQGITARTHRIAVQTVFDVPELKRAILSVAFVTSGGVKLVEEALKKNAARTVVYAGIRNELTSKQGLEGLLAIGVAIYCVDTGLRRCIYHPKIYFARGNIEARLLIGSSNLTLGGLNNNIEASLAINMDLTDSKDANLAGAIEGQLSGLESVHPKNITAVSSLVDLKRLFAAGLLVDEDLVSPPRTRPPEGANNKIAEISPIILKTKYVSKQAMGIAVPAKLKPLKAAGIGSVIKPSKSGIRHYVPVWNSRPLLRSNINLTTSKTAAKKNVLSLGQGGWAKTIDFQHYFRDEVFAALDWAPSETAGTDEASGDFEVVLVGVPLGVFPLRVRFSQSSATVKQKNVTTRLVWGKLLELISIPENLNRVVYLSRDVDDPKRFLMEID